MTKNFETPFTQYETGEMRLLRNEMQLELMGRVLGENSKSIGKDAWIEKNSKDFAEILDEHPEILEEYRSGDKRLALERMEESLATLHEERYKKVA